MEKTISIIVPVYNAHKTLARCVNSLTTQTYKNIEIILVNDGSKDDSLELCIQFALQDSRIRVVDKPNGGVSTARNAGLDAAQGKFIMFCDSDDWVAPDWCESMLANWTESDFVVCRISRDDIPPEEAPQSPCTHVPRDAFMHRPQLMCALYNKLFVRQTIQEHHICFCKELRLGEDFVFVLEYLCHVPGNICYVERELYNYDTSSDGLSKKAPLLEQCDLFYKKLSDTMDALNFQNTESIQIRNRFALSHFVSLLEKTASDSDKTIGQKIQMAKKVATLESFRICSTEGPLWESKLVQYLYTRKNLRPLMLYLILRAWKHHTKGI